MKRITQIIHAHRGYTLVLECGHERHLDEYPSGNKALCWTCEANDVAVVNHGSIVVLRPLTPRAEDWCDEHLPSDTPLWGNDAFAIELNYVQPIIDGMRADGLTVR